MLSGCFDSSNDTRAIKRLRVHRIIYILLLTLLAGSAVTSNFMMNLAWTLLFANWLLEWDMKRKFAQFAQLGLLHFSMAIFLVSVVGLVWSDDIIVGLDSLRQTLPLLAIPLVVLTSRPLASRQLRIVATGYVGTVLVVSVIGFVRWLTIPDLPYRAIVPYISHIRFSLNTCLAVCILVASMAKCFATGRKPAKQMWFAVVRPVLAVVLVIWFLFFLLLLQSYTGLIILLVTALVVLLFSFGRSFFSKTSGKQCGNGLKVRLMLLCVVLLSVGSVAGLCCHYVNEYYTPRLEHADQSRYTVAGNPYTFARDGLIECGRKVNDFVCEPELRRQWGRVSGMSYDSLTPVGYPVGSALVRYLNAMGVSKDSAGVMTLSRGDIKAIEQGIANPVYNQKASIRRMVYVMLFEYENYRCFHSVRGFTMLQRIELWSAAWGVVADNWLHGVGTGDVRSELHRQLTLSRSPLAETDMLPHNQYLFTMMSFGLIAFAALCAVAVWAFVRQRLWRNTLWIACATIVIVSCLTEDTLLTCAGAIFSALSLSLISTVKRYSK